MYTANVTDYYNETRRHWQQTADAFGRLTKVLEPDGSTNITASPTLETDYQYDALNNLRSVNQHGLNRTFVYDGLSRLRHSAVSRMVAARIPLTTIAKIVGWSDSTTIAMATRYSHPEETEMRAAVEAISQRVPSFFMAEGFIFNGKYQRNI